VSSRFARVLQLGNGNTAKTNKTGKEDKMKKMNKGREKGVENKALSTPGKVAAEKKQEKTSTRNLAPRVLRAKCTSAASSPAG